jgi:alkanesulfonate monooxygenase SsuD/methylene tetrahydromethanopterin reductase-like flavin-dependent oxidoreductase (luciferase family)
VRGTPEECAEQLAEHVEAGVQHLVFVPEGYAVEQLEAIAAEVIPRLRRMSDG